MKLNNFIIAESALVDWKSKLFLVNRDENLKKQIKVISNFHPYLYVDKTDVKFLSDNFGRDIFEIENASKKNLYDKSKELVKIKLNNHIKAWDISRTLTTYEADVRYENKWLIDEVSELTTNKLRINYLDIETTSDQGFPTYKNPVEQIISLACYDNYLNKSFLWIFHDIFEKNIIQQVKEEGILEIREFKTENDMLNDFLDFIHETSPDIFTSWNVSFDIGYLTSRLERLKLPVEKLSPFYGTAYQNVFYKGLVSWQKGPGVYGKRFGIKENEKHVEIKGLIYFDMLTAYKNIISKEMASFKLDYVAHVELGMNKLQTHFDIGKKWKTDPKYIEEYNYLDVYLLYKIDQKMKILNRYITIRDKAFLNNINDAFSTGKILDSFILKKYKDEFIFPSKIWSDEEVDDKLAGGFVREPISGVHKNVAVFDFSGFYPSLMKTFNLSSEKLIKEKIYHKDTTVDEIVDVSEFIDFTPLYDEEKETIVYRIRTNKYSADLTYEIDKKGVLSQASDDLIELRKEAKKEMHKYQYGSVDYEQAYNNQFSYKFIINGMYGASGYKGFRFFNVNNANAITGFARMLSKWIQYNLDKNGWKVILGDTDSVFAKLKTDSLEENKKEINEQIEPLIKDLIKEFVYKFLPKEKVETFNIKMDCEKIYSKLLTLDVKKRYVGLLKYFEGEEVNKKLHYMGMDFKKANTIDICKRAQQDIALKILEEEDISNTLRKYYEEIKQSNDIDAFKTSSKLEKHQHEYITKIPAVRAADWSNKNLGTMFRGGTKFYTIYASIDNDSNLFNQKDTSNDTDIIAFEDVKQLNNLNLVIDRNKYYKDLFNKIDNITRSLPSLKDINVALYNEYAKNTKRKTNDNTKQITLF